MWLAAVVGSTSLSSPCTARASFPQAGPLAAFVMIEVAPVRGGADAVLVPWREVQQASETTSGSPGAAHETKREGSLERLSFRSQPVAHRARYRRVKRSVRTRYVRRYVTRQVRSVRRPLLPRCPERYRTLFRTSCKFPVRTYWYFY